MKQPKIHVAPDIPYYEASKADLLKALNDPARVASQFDIVASVKIARVLDVCCGIGQALFPLAVMKNAVGIGVDISDEALRMGREVYASQIPDARVEFIQSRAEALPFESEQFDIVNCGLALSYLDNAHAIAEVARVLRRGGLFLLKIHHARYYLWEMWAGLTSFRMSSVVYGGRVLVAGSIYHLIGRQPNARLLNETFQSKWLLNRELAKHNLSIEREQATSNPLTPAYVIRKAD